MSVFVADLCIAAVDAVNAYRSGLYSESDSGMTRKVVIGALIVGAIWAALYGFDRYQKKQKKNRTVKDKSLFGDLCTSHRLTAQERTILESIAMASPGEPEESIFIHPEQFDAVEVSKLDPEAKDQLRRKIFGDLSVA